MAQGDWAFSRGLVDLASERERELESGVKSVRSIYMGMGGDYVHLCHW